MINTKRISELAEKLNLTRSENARRREIFDEVHSTVQRAFDTADTGSLAAAIVRAGKIRRGEIAPEPQFTNDASGRRAKMIVNMGRRRRGEKEIE